MTNQTTRKKVGFWIPALIIVGLIGSCFSNSDKSTEDQLSWSVPLAKEDAQVLATTILGQGRIRGCGDIHVLSQEPELHQITVSCQNDPEKNPIKHRLTYWRSFKVDGQDVAHNVSDITWLSTAYCVKEPDGTWSTAFMKLDDARDLATKLSQAQDKPAKIYASDSLNLWASQKDDNGTWFTPINSTQKAQSNKERTGCELESVS